MADPRPSIDYTMMMVAKALAARSTCCRRSVGCVLTNHRNHIIGTGYNGVAAGQPHCIEHPCPGAELPSGTGLDECEALHSEWNALQQCRDVWDIHTVYCTTAPCVTCVKMFLNTSAERIVFIDDYPQAEAAKQLWGKRQWCKMQDNWERNLRPRLQMQSSGIGHKIIID